MSDTLTLAMKEYSGADQAGKAILEKIFGKEAFQSDFRQIKSFEDACLANNISPLDVIPYKTPANKKQEALNSLAMMFEIVQAINPGWEADYSNVKQYKWFPWFEWDKKTSGFRFYDTDFDNVITYSASGSRLCCETSEKAEYIGRQFIDIWNKILIK